MEKPPRTCCPCPARGAPEVFVDKGGTLVEDLLYNVDPMRMRFTARALSALRLLLTRGYTESW